MWGKVKNLGHQLLSMFCSFNLINPGLFLYVCYLIVVVLAKQAPWHALKGHLHQLTSCHVKYALLEITVRLITWTHPLSVIMVRIKTQQASKFAYNVPLVKDAFLDQIYQLNVTMERIVLLEKQVVLYAPVDIGKIFFSCSLDSFFFDEWTFLAAS